MKKLLLGTTALIGAMGLAGAASAQQVTTSSPFTVTIGGFANFTLGWVDEDGAANTRDYGFRHDSEIFITARAKADNGLVYGFRIELETDAAATGANTDEAAIFMSGSWGQLELGMEDSRADRAFNKMPNGWGPLSGDGYGPDGNIPATFLTANRFTNVIGGGTNRPYATLTVPADVFDASKITYTTPNFSGFQLGASWTPDASVEGTANGSRSELIPATALTATGPTAATSSSTGEPLGIFGYQNVFDIVATYDGTFGSVGVALAAAYYWGDAKDATAAGASSHEDLSAWGLSAAVTFAGFTVGATYANRGDSHLAKIGPFDDDSWTAGISVQYAIGPWVIGGFYQYAEQEGNTLISGNDEVHNYQIGALYNLAPGLQVYGALTWFDIEEDGAVNAAGTIQTLGRGESDIFVFTVGTRVTF